MVLDLVEAAPAPKEQIICLSPALWKIRNRVCVCVKKRGFFCDTVIDRQRNENGVLEKRSKNNRKSKDQKKKFHFMSDANIAYGGAIALVGSGQTFGSTLSRPTRAGPSFLAIARASVTARIAKTSPQIGGRREIVTEFVRRPSSHHSPARRRPFARCRAFSRFPAPLRL